MGITSDVAQYIVGFYRHLFESQTLLPHPVFLFANVHKILGFDERNSKAPQCSTNAVNLSQLAPYPKHC